MSDPANKRTPYSLYDDLPDEIIDLLHSVTVDPCRAVTFYMRRTRLKNMLQKFVNARKRTPPIIYDFENIALLFGVEDTIRLLWPIKYSIEHRSADCGIVVTNFPTNRHGVRSSRACRFRDDESTISDSSLNRFDPPYNESDNFEHDRNAPAE